MVNDKGELVYYAFYVDCEPISITEAFKNPKWVRGMI